MPWTHSQCLGFETGRQRREQVRGAGLYSEKSMGAWSHVGTLQAQLWLEMKSRQEQKPRVGKCGGVCHGFNEKGPTWSWAFELGPQLVALFVALTGWWKCVTQHKLWERKALPYFQFVLSALCMCLKAPALGFLPPCLPLAVMSPY